MNLLGTIVSRIGLSLLIWVSILFVFATGNVLVFAFAGLLSPDFVGIFLLALVLNILAGLLISGIWSGASESKWDSIALLAGFMLACMCMVALVYVTEDNWVLNLVYRHYETIQAKILLSIPALAVLGCFFFLWKNKKKANDRI